MGCETFINFTSQASNNAMIYFGFMSTVSITTGANTDPTASYSGAIIYRLSGDTQWRIQVSATARPRPTYTTVGSRLPLRRRHPTASRMDIHAVQRVPALRPPTALNCFATASINGVQVKDINNILKQFPIAYGSLAAMKVGGHCRSRHGQRSEPLRRLSARQRQPWSHVIPNG